MEVDKHPPSFRTLRSYSTKRARSPDTPSSTNRPHKRPSLAVNENLPLAVYPQTDFRSGWGGSGNSSRHPSEDWVQQAGGLTIDSPLPGDGFSFPNTRPNDVRDDENMTMDADDEDENTRPPRPPHISQTITQLTTSNLPQYLSHQEQHQSLLAPTAQRSSCPVPSQQVPSIDAHPTTPPDPPVGPGVQNGESTQPITRPSSPTAMSISPSSSWNANLVWTKNRKQRFTMGPRADCEKCLLGAKGHWMHLD